MSTNEHALAIANKLLHDMEGRRGFRRGGIDAETIAEWDKEWVSLIDAALREAKAEGLEWAAKHWQDQQYEFMESCRDEAKRIREERT